VLTIIESATYVNSIKTLAEQEILSIARSVERWWLTDRVESYK
jgi:hypothetical protein